MTDRPDDLDACAPEFVEWLNSSNDQGITMLVARLADLIEANDPTLFIDLQNDELSFFADGPDPSGVFAVDVLRKETGAAVSRLEVHWRALMPED